MPTTRKSAANPATKDAPKHAGTPKSSPRAKSSRRTATPKSGARAKSGEDAGKTTSKSGIRKRVTRSSTHEPAYRHRTTRLDNGLTVATIAVPHLHTASVSAFVRVGSRHEDESTNGLSHFLEHMFFRGCDAYPDSTALNAAMEDLGGFLDGFTTRDFSAYHSSVHPDLIGEATAILGRIFQAPMFSDIEIERSIILEEVLDALDEKGREIDLDTWAYREAFPGHPLGQTIDGPMRNLKRFDLSDIERHRRKFYGAENMVLCFAGNVDPMACERHAKKAFGGLFPGRRAREGKPPPLPARAPRLKFVASDDPQTRARVSFRTTSDGHRDYPALLLIRRILDGGLSARLQVELVERRGIVYDIGADLEVYADAGLFDFELAAQHKKLPYALQELGRVIAELAEDGVGQEELDRVRRRARMSLEFGLDSTSELSSWFGATQLFRTPTQPEERMRELESVTTTRIREVARKYFRPERLTIAAVGGAGKRDIDETKKVIREWVKRLAA